MDKLLWNVVSPTKKSSVTMCEVREVFLMFSFPRSCCYLQQVEDRHTILPLMRKEEKIKGSERKRSLLEEISTLKEKRRLETLSGAQHLSCMRRHKIPYQAKKKNSFH